MEAAGFDVVVIGGGSAGCVVASRLSEDESRTVCLLEAGPDYGPHDSGRWPEDILDGRLPASSHDWKDDRASLRAARILGGCSAYNMCTLMHPAPRDHDAWVEATGDPGLGRDRFEPQLRKVEERMALRRFADAELDPWFRGLAEGCAEIGLPVHEDGNAPDATEGSARFPFNLRGTLRWNAAFAYLDPARGRANLAISADALADRVVIRGERATGVEVIVGGERRQLRAGRVVVCGGAYCSPAVLLRSGIGAEDELDRLGIRTLAALPVGDGLRNHFGVPVRFQPSESMLREIADHRERADDATTQGVVKVRSSGCPEGTWDLHLLAAIFPGERHPVLSSSSMLMQANWNGAVRLRSTDPSELPAVPELDLEDAADLERVVEGVELARRLAGTAALRDRVAAELEPGRLGAAELRGRGRAGLSTYFHPVGTCAMGAVTGAAGRVHGLENLHVVDASVIPRPLRASPHLSVLALAERASEALALEHA